jgi:uncharacterized protein (DUF952 family)
MDYNSSILNKRVFMSFIYHITPRTDWEAALESGDYRPASLESEGFIHCSTKDQVAPVANALYTGHTGLDLLVIDTERLSAKLQWDAPAHPDPGNVSAELRDKFPHIYGPLNLDAVIEVRKFVSNADGIFIFPNS